MYVHHTNFDENEKEAIRKDFMKSFPGVTTWDVDNFLELYDSFEPNATEKQKIEGIVCL